MQRKRLQPKKWTILFLSFLIFVTGIPLDSGVLAANARLEIENRPTDAQNNELGTFSNPIVVDSKWISNSPNELKVKYIGGTGNPASVNVAVQVNGRKQQQSKALNHNATVTFTNIELTQPGLNTVQFYAEGDPTVSADTIYYLYMPTNTLISLLGFDNKGTSAFDPVLTGDNMISLNGYFHSSIVGSNIRMKISTNNGKSIEDLSGKAPTVSGNRFTFTDIELKPGLNQISFYERVGNVTKELYQFYVQYNNTPLFTELTINDVDVSLPVGDSAPPVVINVPSMNRLTLKMDGIALNAETVTVTNTNTGETLDAQVHQRGYSFSLNLPAVVGENELQIRAYNANKEVTLVNRKIIVTVGLGDETDQFYGVKVDGKLLDPNLITVIDSKANHTIEGIALINMENKLELTEGNFYFRIDDLTASVTDSVYDVVQPEIGKMRVNKGQNNYTAYEFLGNNGVTFPSGNPQNGFVLTDGHLYEISLRYTYTVQETNVAREIVITNYKYRFQYADATKPRFDEVLYKSSGQPLFMPPFENAVTTLPLELQFKTKNIVANNFEVFYNDKKLSPGTDFVITGRADTWDLKLNKLPSGKGTIKLVYPNAENPQAEISFILNALVTPYVQITYTDGSGQLRSFDDGYQIENMGDIHELTVRTYNYPLKRDTSGKPSNFTILLNGVEANSINSNAISHIDTTANTFKIREDLFIKNRSNNEYNLRRGNNTLEIILTDDPQVKFTYNIFFYTAKLPSIEEIELKLEQNNNVFDLTKNPGDLAYQTSSMFLRSFSFKVNDASHVYIEKNGNRIVEYRKNGNNWVRDLDGQDYLDAKRNISREHSNLLQYFEDSGGISSDSSTGTNFNFKSNRNDKTLFEANLRSRDFGNLISAVRRYVPEERIDQVLELFPLALKKNGNTTYTIVAVDDLGSVVRHDVIINSQTQTWEIISPTKSKETDPYIIVNSNSVPIKVFAENATKVLFGKTEAYTRNTTDPDFYYDDDLGRIIPRSYYVFEAKVDLKPGLNTIKYTVETANNKYNDQVIIYNTNAPIGGAEHTEILGKKVSFSAFDKSLSLKFPKGTVLLAPSRDRAGDEVRDPRSEIFVDVPLYFGIADRTTGQVNLPPVGRYLENRLVLESNFNYASPLYYIDGGNIGSRGDLPAPGGRDPYFSGEAYIHGSTSYLEQFSDRHDYNLVPSNRGELTLNYDSSIVNAANNTLSVFFNDGSGWTNIGGVVNVSRQTITVPFDKFGYYMVMKTRETYNDVVQHPYARDDMETLYAKGIMPNFSGNSFGANRSITRGEMATMLIKALDLPINAGPYRDGNERDPLEPTFIDVRPARDTWDYQYKYVETAARAGIIKGKQPGYFRPDESLTRQEAAVMIARAMNLKLSKTPEDAKKDLSKSFIDAQNIDFYAAQSVLAVTKAKLMQGSPTIVNNKEAFQFSPNSTLTRAEMAVITVRVMTQLKKLPK